MAYLVTGLFRSLFCVHFINVILDIKKNGDIYNTTFVSYVSTLKLTVSLLWIWWHYVLSLTIFQNDVTNIILIREVCDVTPSVGSSHLDSLSFTHYKVRKKRSIPIFLVRRLTTVIMDSIIIGPGHSWFQYGAGEARNSNGMTLCWITPWTFYKNNWLQNFISLTSCELAGCGFESG